MPARSCPPWAIGLCLGLVVGLGAGRAAAFYKGCHQDITREVTDQGLWPRGASSPGLSPEQATLPNELDIDLGPESGLWTLSAIIGNQYVDGGRFDPGDIVAIAQHAARPELQHQHCLRAPEDDGPAGDGRALAGCKAFILERIEAALGPADLPDLDATETVRLQLIFRGEVDITLPRFAFQLGQASHALQDAFTHAFRSSDKQRVRTVLNWVDWLRGDAYSLERDGFRHLVDLDDCGAGSAGGPERRGAAAQATRELFLAVADDSGGRAGRLARAGAAVDAWFGIEAGCTFDNDWCGAAEPTQNAGLGCAAAGAGTSDVGEVVLMLLTLSGIGGGRRFRRPRIGSLVVAAGALALVPPAAADVIGKATPEEQRRLESRPLGLLVGGGISIDKAGYDVAVGVRYDLGRRFAVGLGLEYNPWFSIESGRTAAGTTQGYGVAVFRLDVRDYLELHTTVSAGVSVLMFDTFAAPKGTYGPFFALSPLGVSFRMSDRFRLLVEPAEIVMPIPQTRGIPLVYRQHRFSVALQTNF